MNPMQRMTQEMRTDLVAYLDGELEEQRVATVEASLADNPVVRHEVEMLTRTWEMLDSLPREAASADFTAKTLKTIVLEEGGLETEKTDWVGGAKRIGGYLGWFAGIIVASVIGFLATYKWTPRENEQLLDDLEVIKRLHIYEEVQSPEFLRALKQDGSLKEPDDNGNGPAMP